MTSNNSNNQPTPTVLTPPASAASKVGPSEGDGSVRDADLRSSSDPLVGAIFSCFSTCLIFITKHQQNLTSFYTLNFYTLTKILKRTLIDIQIIIQAKFNYNVIDWLIKLTF